MIADRNIVIGLTVALFGSVLGSGAYILLENIPLTAMGIGLIVVGLAWASVPSYPLQRRVALELIKSSCTNIGALLEFLGATKRAIYLPSKVRGRVVAYVPLRGNVKGLPLKTIVDSDGRILVRQGESIGLVIDPPSIGLGVTNPGFENDSDVEALVGHAVVESEIAKSVKIVRSEDGFKIEIHEVRVDVDHARFRTVMGSLPSCLVAQMIASSLSRPVQVVSERQVGNKLIVSLRLLDWTGTVSI
ncbi:MAG: hypothetical protein QXP84_03070 [Candidatus Korarchaeum sp.]